MSGITGEELDGDQSFQRSDQAVLQPNAYDYAPLPTDSSIRILDLKVDTGIEEERLHVSLRIVDLADEPVYDTLSYTWGHPRTVYMASEAIPPGTGQDRCIPILCDGQELLITKNLHDFLRQLHFLRKTQPDATVHTTTFHPGAASPEEYKLELPTEIWIDAICINQNDVLERNHQVAMMSQIYRSCRKIFIWLGEKDTHTDRAMRLLTHLALTPLDQAKSLSSYHLLRPEVAKVTHASEEDWWALYAFFNRAWFHRAWIVQEVAFGTRPLIWCGSTFLAFGNLYWAAKWLQASGFDVQLADIVSNEVMGMRPRFIEESINPRRFDPTDPPRLISTLDPGVETAVGQALLRLDALVLDENEPNKYGLDGQLLTMLETLRYTLASDPRDKIFAFLDLAKYNRQWPEEHAPVPSLRVDYRKGTEAVYLETARFLLASARNLHLLSSVQDASWTKLQGLPSWVPDWSTKMAPNRLMENTAYFAGCPWSASKSLDWKVPKDFHTDGLVVQGARIDSIIEASPVMLSDYRDKREDFDVSKVAQIALALPRVYPWAWNVTKIGSNDASFNRTQAPIVEPGSRGIRPFAVNIFPVKDSIEVPMAQSRVEALWRTLIADCYRQKHPAGFEAGFGFGDMFVDKIQESGHIYAMNSQRSFQQDQPGRVRNMKLEQVYRGYESTWINLVESELNCRSHGDDPMKPFRQTEELSRMGYERAMPANGIGYMPLDEAPLDEDGKLKKLNDHESKQMLDYMNQMNHVSLSRRVFRTGKDFIGNGPRSLAIDDQVWVLAGAKVPLVLRPLNDGHYMVIGEAYVHGIMHGEALDFVSFDLVDIVLV